MEQTILMWVGVLTFVILLIRSIFSSLQTAMVAPLIAQISSLNSEISNLNKTIENLRSDLIMMRERIAGVEASAKSLHQRVDTLEDVVNEHIGKAS